MSQAQTHSECCPRACSQDPSSAFTGCFSVAPQVKNSLPCSHDSFLHKQCVHFCPRLDAFVQDDEDDHEVKNEGQAHVFAFWHDLTEEQQRDLEHDFDNIEECFFHHNFLLQRQYAVSQRQHQLTSPPVRMNWDRKRPPELQAGANLSIWEKMDSGRQSTWRNHALDMYVRGQIGIIILHGGLDHITDQQCPNGLLDFGLLSRKSLLQLYFERIRRLQHLAQRRSHSEELNAPVVPIPIFIMCNAHNHDIIADFLVDNGYFGLDEHCVFLFKQGVAPVLDTQGRFILSERHRILQEPCGNGYLLKAMGAEGMLAELKSRCVSYVYVMTNDNLLAKVGDPGFIGFSIGCEAEAAVKCFQRESVEERVGLYCSVEAEMHHQVGHVHQAELSHQISSAIVEDYEMHEELLADRHFMQESRPFVYDAMNASQYVFKLSFLSRIGRHYRHQEPRWHAIPQSRSRINLVTGLPMGPTKSWEKFNAFRMEHFLMDCFELCNLSVGLMTSKTEFGFIKAMAGAKSPHSALLAMSRLHQSWIVAGGGEFLENRFASSRDNEKCEVSPLVSYDGEDLAGQFWMPIELPCYVPGKKEQQDFSSIPLRDFPGLSAYFHESGTKYAQSELRQEMQFALGLSPPPPKKYRGECAENFDQLPPTPEESEGVAEEESARHAGERHRTQGQDSARTATVEWLLSPRVGGTSSAALVGFPKRRLPIPHSLFHSKNAGHHRFESSRTAGIPAATVVVGGKAKSLGMYGDDSVRGKILHSSAINHINSLRLIPPNFQGLELSEYGRRQVDTSSARDNAWWQGRPKKHAKEKEVHIPEELGACCIA